MLSDKQEKNNNKTKQQIQVYFHYYRRLTLACQPQADTRVTGSRTMLR